MNSNLRDLRLKKGVTGDEMAALLGIKKSSYSKKENGQTKFSLNEAKIVADFFDLNIEDIFFKKEVSKNDTHTS